MPVLEARHVSISIDRPPDEVYRYAADPRHLPAWASGLGSIREVDGRWTSDSPMGAITIAFVAPNALGVLDHDVTLPSGEVVHNAMRVIPNGDGAEVVFSLFRGPEITAAKFDEDAAWVAKDLQTLKRTLEAR